MTTMKTNNMMIVSMISTLLISFSACGSISSVDDTPNPNTSVEEQPTGRAATLYTTTADRGASLVKSFSAIGTSVNMAPTTIQVDPAKTYQEMDGFGFALTYSTCYNLMQMDAASRIQFLKQTYSETEGYGVSYARISIGCNDFSSTEYSLCDSKGLENFALHNDETKYVIPIIKEVLAINPKLKIIAAPWTCPKWMKVKDLTTMAAFDSWTDGHLNPNYRADYAQYFVKFVQAMKTQGIDIYAVSPQNEPLNRANCASLYMPWDEEAAFVRELAAAFDKNGIKTKIYVFDHNYNYDNIADQEDYPIKVYNALGNSFEGSELVVGAAYHDYGGANTELTDIHAQASDKELIFSESSIGTWNNGRDLSKRLVADMRNVTLGTVNQWCKAVLVWNLMLDEKMGPNLDGGCQTCYGAVDIFDNYKTLRYNSHYYVIAHMAAVVRPGAVRLGVAPRSYAGADVVYSAFLNPDGSKAVVLLNSGDYDFIVTVSDGNDNFRVTVPVQGVVSSTWK